LDATGSTASFFEKLYLFIKKRIRKIDNQLSSETDKIQAPREVRYGPAS
jgi:hypothetical protein